MICWTLLSLQPIEQFAEPEFGYKSVTDHYLTLTYYIFCLVDDKLHMRKPDFVGNQSHLGFQKPRTNPI